jgi:hypothetical protein
MASPADPSPPCLPPVALPPLGNLAPGRRLPPVAAAAAGSSSSSRKRGGACNTQTQHNTACKLPVHTCIVVLQCKKQVWYSLCCSFVSQRPAVPSCHSHQHIRPQALVNKCGPPPDGAFSFCLYSAQPGAAKRPRPATHRPASTAPTPRLPASQSAYRICTRAPCDALVKRSIHYKSHPEDGAQKNTPKHEGAQQILQTLPRRNRLFEGSLPPDILPESFASSFSCVNGQSVPTNNQRLPHNSGPRHPNRGQPTSRCASKIFASSFKCLAFSFLCVMAASRFQASLYVASSPGSCSRACSRNSQQQR